MDTELRAGCSASPDLAPVLAGAAVDDARIGFLEGGAKKNDIRRFDIHHPKIKCSITVEGLDNLLTLFNIQILRVKVPVHTILSFSISYTYNS